MHEYYKTYLTNNPIKDFDDINTNELNIASKDEIVCGTSNKPLIGTHSLETCFSIILSSENTNYTLCHVLNNYQLLLNEMLKNFTSSKQIDVTIIPGFYTTIEKINEVISYLKTTYPYHKFNISIQNLGHYKSPEYNTIDFAYDTRTGEYLKPNYDEILTNERMR